MKLKLFIDGWRMTYTGCFQDQNKPSMLRPGLWRHLLKSINMWKKRGLVEDDRGLSTE